MKLITLFVLVFCLVFTAYNCKIFLLLIQKHMGEVSMHLSAPQLSTQTGMLYKTTKTSQAIGPKQGAEKPGPGVLQGSKSVIQIQ